ncbi:hypothetical protein R1flu_012756 [Riccia fluitans]|uniref:Ribosomal protein L32 n=1 Tax=Riccia fluitans TaxID=41844 RepID=A0ABD1ZE00_9MARC
MTRKKATARIQLTLCSRADYINTGALLSFSLKAKGSRHFGSIGSGAGPSSFSVVKKKTLEVGEESESFVLQSEFSTS